MSPSVEAMVAPAGLKARHSSGSTGMVGPDDASCPTARSAIADVVHVVSHSPAGASSRGMASSQANPVTVSIVRPSTHQPAFA